MFKRRQLCVATMHGKEKVIAPILEQGIGVKCIIEKRLNTDLLGTFSGEIKRVGTPLETARQKCLEAMSISGCDLAVSSEGSFGAHPTIGFIPCDEEILYFFDQKNGIEIWVRELSIETNYGFREFSKYNELKEFAEKSKFPEHALIVKDHENNVVGKGINNWKLLENSFKIARKQSEIIRVETDMRAHFNPTRMKVIENCAKKLLHAINSHCPNCNYPGFIVTEAEPGLPCELCGLPTHSTLKYISECKHCSHKAEKLFPREKNTEEAMYCDFCNP